MPLTDHLHTIARRVSTVLTFFRSDLVLLAMTPVFLHFTAFCLLFSPLMFLHQNINPELMTLHAELF